MPAQFCEHLDDYGAQYVVTEATYQLCVNLMEKIMADGPEASRLGLVNTALAEWAAHDTKLRDMLVAEVQAGRIRVPLALVKRRRKEHEPASRHAHHPGHLVCATCRFVVPRLSYPEWQIAHNGVAAFKGEELPTPAAV